MLILIVLLIGPPASGKTAIGAQLVSQLGWPYLSIDTYRALSSTPWPDLLCDLDRLPGSVIVECCVPPVELLTRIAQRNGFVVGVNAHPTVLRDRLTQRGWTSNHIERAIKAPRPQLRDDMRLDSSFGPVDTTALIDKLKSHSI